jgi:hypothetical protein
VSGCERERTYKRGWVGERERTRERGCERGWVKEWVSVSEYVKVSVRVDV